jgi:hypothetical protein
MRRAVRMSLRFFGAVRANSFAVLAPMPDEAPVGHCRRHGAADAGLEWTGKWVGGCCEGRGARVGREVLQELN